MSWRAVLFAGLSWVAGCAVTAVLSLRAARCDVYNWAEDLVLAENTSPEAYRFAAQLERDFLANKPIEYWAYSCRQK